MLQKTIGCRRRYTPRNPCLGNELRPGGPGNQYSTLSRLSFSLAAVFPVKPLDASGGIDEFLFAGEKWVAARTDFEADLLFGRASLPRLSTGTVYGRVKVLWMNIGFHRLVYSCCGFCLQ